jgi:hypothetical protein
METLDCVASDRLEPRRLPMIGNERKSKCDDGTRKKTFRLIIYLFNTWREGEEETRFASL